VSRSGERVELGGNRGVRELTPLPGGRRARRCAAAGREAANERTSGPIGVTAMPRPSIQSRKSGGTQTRTS
jgi:hypothetical protein